MNGAPTFDATTTEILRNALFGGEVIRRFP